MTKTEQKIADAVAQARKPYADALAVRSQALAELVDVITEMTKGTDAQALALLESVHRGNCGPYNRAVALVGSMLVTTPPKAARALEKRQ